MRNIKSITSLRQFSFYQDLNYRYKEKTIFDHYFKYFLSSEEFWEISHVQFSTFTTNIKQITVIKGVKVIYQTVIFTSILWNFEEGGRRPIVGGVEGVFTFKLSIRLVIMESLSRYVTRRFNSSYFKMHIILFNFLSSQTNIVWGFCTYGLYE